MKFLNTLAAIAATGFVGLSAAHAAPVDLSSWTAEGQGSWVPQPGNDAVLQTINGEPTVFFNGIDSQGLSLSGSIEVQTTNDDDFIGFVLGYNSGDLTNPNADYILIDWKQGDQTFPGLGASVDGLAISRVQGAITSANAWQHSGVVTELARATTLGSTGWDDNTSYTFDLIFTQTMIQVFVNGALELSVNGTFNNGSFGFYNYSQGSVLYAGITEDVVVSEVPLPAAAWFFMTGAAGYAASRKKKKA